jgi:hypothetical protein
LNTGQYPARGAWARAEQPFLDGSYYRNRPKGRYPVLITPDGPVSSTSELQQLADTVSLLDVRVAAQVDWYGVEIPGKEVTVADIDYELFRIENKALVSFGVGGNIFIMFNGRARIVRIVEALKEGGTLEDEGESEDEEGVTRGGGDGEDDALGEGDGEGDKFVIGEEEDGAGDNGG